MLTRCELRRLSIRTAIAVAACYTVYHGIEIYFIVPKVYGNRLRVSGLVVLVTLIITASVGGVLAALLVLPLVASYPIVERIWLEKNIGRRVIKEHERKKGEN